MECWSASVSPSAESVQGQVFLVWKEDERFERETMPKVKKLRPAAKVGRVEVAADGFR